MASAGCAVRRSDCSGPTLSGLACQYQQYCSARISILQVAVGRAWAQRVRGIGRLGREWTMSTLCATAEMYEAGIDCNVQNCLCLYFVRPFILLKYYSVGV